MSIETDINQAFTDRVRWAALFNPDADIKWPNTSFEFSNEVRQLEVTIFRNYPENDPSWGSEKERRGIFQLNIHDPLQVGSIPVLAIQSQLCDAFAKGTWLTVGSTVVKLGQHPRPMSPLESPEKTIFPISITWRCDS